MKTIKERAEEFGKQGCGENCIFVCEDWKDENGVCGRLASRVRLYKSIATEQKAIDIDKTCTAFCAVCLQGEACPYPDKEMCEELKRFADLMEG